MNEVRVSSFDELFNQLHHDAWKPALGRFRSNFAFRGMESASDDLTTSLHRLGGHYSNQEGHLLRNFRKFALLSLMSNAETALDGWLEKRPQLYRRIIVPAELKWEIRDKLDQANITERVLFPGLDGLSRWLKRYYSPRSNSVPMTGPEKG